MLALEVLVAELLAVDGLAAGTLLSVRQRPFNTSSPCEPRFLSSKRGAKGTYVAAGEVTTLEHELGDDTVELGARVAEALLASAEGAEVLGRLGDDIVEELEVDAAGLGYTAHGVSN